MVVDKRIKEAAAELKAQQENEVDNYYFCDHIIFMKILNSKIWEYWIF